MFTRRVLILAAFATLPLPCLAADFVFQVPVNLENVDTKGRPMYAECIVSNADKTTRGRAHEYVGNNGIMIPLRDGSYSGTIEVPVDASRKRVTEARSYLCSLIYEGRPLRDAVSAGRIVSGPESGNTYETSGSLR